MDIEKLIEQLNARGLSNGSSLGYHSGLFDEAATALSTLQAENEKLRADLARLTAERDAAISDLERETFGTPRACDCCKHKKNSQCKRNLLYGWCKWEWRGIEKED